MQTVAHGRSIQTTATGTAEDARCGMRPLDRNGAASKLELRASPIGIGTSGSIRLRLDSRPSCWLLFLDTFSILDSGSTPFNKHFVCMRRPRQWSASFRSEPSRAAGAQSLSRAAAVPVHRLPGQRLPAT